MKFTLTKPIGKVQITPQGLKLALGVFGGEKALIPFAQITDVSLSFLPQLANTLIAEEVVQIRISSGEQLAFALTYGGADLVSSISDLISSDISASGSASGSAIKKLADTRRDLSKKWIPKNQTPGNLQYKFTGQFSVAITDTYILVATGVSVDPSLMIPLQEIENYSVKKTDDGPLRDAAIEILTKSGPPLAIAGSKSQISHAFQLLSEFHRNGANDNLHEGVVQDGNTQLKLNDAHRKLSQKWVDWNPDSKPEKKLLRKSAIEESEFEAITRILKTNSSVWRRTKDSWKELVGSIQRNTEIQAHLKKLENIYQQSNAAVKSVSNCDLFETRKGGRVVNRSSSSSSSGGGFGAGVRVGGIGIGGGSSSRSGYSTSKTVYNPAPDELTLIDSGSFVLDDSQLTFVGEQFNKQVQIAKLAHFELDFEYRTMKIVAPGKEKNFYVRFSDFFDVLESAIFLQALMQLKSQSDISGATQSLEQGVRQIKDQFMAEQWASAMFFAEDISEVLLASNSEHLKQFEEWTESVFDQNQQSD